MHDLKKMHDLKRSDLGQNKGRTDLKRHDLGELICSERAEWGDHIPECLSVCQWVFWHRWDALVSGRVRVWWWVFCADEFSTADEMRLSLVEWDALVSSLGFVCLGVKESSHVLESGYLSANMIKNRVLETRFQCGSSWKMSMSDGCSSGSRVLETQFLPGTRDATFPLCFETRQLTKFLAI